MCRELTERERDVLEFMIEYADPMDGAVTAEERSQWRAQLGSVRAGRACQCGTCPSIELHVDAESSAPADHRVVRDAAVLDASLLLFVDEGLLSYLELAPHSDDRFDQFPPVDQVSAN